MEGINRLSPSSLKTILIVIVVSALTSILAINSLLLARVQDTIMNASEIELVSTFKDNIRYNLIRGQFDQAYTKCRKLSKNQNILSIVITTADNGTICNFGVVGLKKPIHDTNLFFDETETEKIANIKIAFNHEIYQHLLIENILLILLSISFFTILGYFIIKKLLSPLFISFTKATWQSKIDLIDKNQFLATLKPLQNYKESLVLFKLLEKFANEVNETQKSLIEHSKNQSRYKIARQVVHDLKSPLAALEECREGNDKEHAQVFGLVINRIYEICSNLIKIGDLNKKKTECLKSEIDSIVLEKNFQYRSNNNISLLNFNFLPENFQLDISPSALKRVLSNILDNAFEAILRKGEVTISSEVNHNFFHLTVSDTGSGMEPEVMNKIFDEGYSKGKISGNGIGLFYVKKCVLAWGGEIRVSSTPLKGTSFFINLPVLQAHKESNQTEYLDSVTQDHLSL